MTKMSTIDTSFMNKTTENDNQSVPHAYIAYARK